MSLPLNADRVAAYIQNVLGIPRIAISSQFRRKLQEFLADKPDWEESSFTRILEGSVLGVPLPCDMIPRHKQEHVRQAKVLADLFEALVVAAVSVPEKGVTKKLKK